MCYRIINSDEEWTFTLEDIPNFERKEQTEQKAQKAPEKGMYVTRKSLTGNDIAKYKGKVYVIISNIDKELWVNSIDNFLWLTQKEMGKIPVVENSEVIGEILLGKDFCGKNYVKEIFVDNITGEFGLNIDVDLDRDRNCIPDLAKRNEIACKLIVGLLNKLKKENDVSNQYDLDYINKSEVFTPETKILIREFPKRIYNSLRNANPITEKLYEKIQKHSKAATLLFNEWEKDPIWKAENKDSIGKQPANAPSVNDYLNKKKLNPDFYPFLTYFREPLMYCISKSIRYLSINDKFINHTKNSVIQEIPNNLKSSIATIVQKVEIAKNDFSENNIKFKKYCHNDIFFVYSENKIIYFSSLLFGLPEKKFKSFVFSKCLDLNGIDLLMIIEKYGLI